MKFVYVALGREKSAVLKAGTPVQKCAKASNDPHLYSRLVSTSTCLWWFLLKMATTKTTTLFVLLAEDTALKIYYFMKNNFNI